MVTEGPLAHQRQMLPETSSESLQVCWLMPQINLYPLPRHQVADSYVHYHVEKWRETLRAPLPLRERPHFEKQEVSRCKQQFYHRAYTRRLLLYLLQDYIPNCNLAKGH